MTRAQGSIASVRTSSIGRRQPSDARRRSSSLFRFAPGSLTSAGSEVFARSHPQVPCCGLSFCTRRGISTARSVTRSIQSGPRDVWPHRGPAAARLPGRRSGGTAVGWREGRDSNPGAACGTCGFALFLPTFTRSSRCEAAADHLGCGRFVKSKSYERSVASRSRSVNRESLKGTQTADRCLGQDS